MPQSAILQLKCNKTGRWEFPNYDIFPMLNSQIYIWFEEERCHGLSTHFILQLDKCTYTYREDTQYKLDDSSVFNKTGLGKNRV